MNIADRNKGIDTLAPARWLQDFGAALARSDSAAAAGLFLPDGHWRDLVAFTWHLKTFTGISQIEAALRETLTAARATAFQLNPDRAPPRHVRRAGVDAIEAFFSFETATGRCSGVVRLVPDAGAAGQLRAWTLLTALEELKGFEEHVGDRRPKGESYSRNFGGDNWHDYRVKARAYADRDPAVLVVGGGQAGLAIAARLGQLEVDTLIVDRMQRVGDNWRKRYHSLTLHNEVHVNHLPYLPFPPIWPVFVPKDKLANWLEAYVESMELNFWTETEFLGGTYDAAAQCWSVRLRRADGIERTMRPRHVVLATSVSGIPSIPSLPGLEDFSGRIMHSSVFTEGSAWTGRNALVLGTGNSGHDVAQDLHSHGAHTTIIQRSPTTIVSIEPSAQKVYALYSEGLSTDDCDLLAASIPYPVLVRAYQLGTLDMEELDKDLLDKLRAVGFQDGLRT